MQQLADLLTQEILCLRQLLDTLHREHQALLTSDASAIELIAAEKQQSLANQSRATQARLHFTQQNANGDPQQQLQQLVDSSTKPQALQQIVDETSSLAQQYQEKNRANGRLINQKQQQAQGALSILRQTDSNPATYSGHGSTPNRQQGRTLGKA